MSQPFPSDPLLAPDTIVPGLLCEARKAHACAQLFSQLSMQISIEALRARIRSLARSVWRASLRSLFGRDLGKRVVLLDEFLEPFLEHMRIDLGRRDIGMT